jgi:gliding motility-associated-like protein
VNPGTTVTPSTDIYFLADTGLVKPTIVWDFDDVASGVLNASSIYNPTHVYASIGTYCVNLIVGSGLCKDTATTCIEVISEPSIEIPNVFTPNGDGLNDLFMVKSSGITSLHADIFDRWGIKLYSWDGVTGSWDGKNKSGNTSSNGVYYYIIKATDFKNETKDYNGHLQLIDSK